MNDRGQSFMSQSSDARHEKLLEEIRENFDYAVNSWREIRQEAKIDMQFAAGDGWDARERGRREDPKQSRPCISEDEIGQYVNQLINDVRESPRSIKLIPTGSGANDKTAELHENKIRNIEYESNAQVAYITAFENAVQRSYGAFRISTTYVSPAAFDQKVVILSIPNPDTVYPDPDFREAAGADMGWCFVIDYFSWGKFKNQFPDSKINSYEQFKEMFHSGIKLSPDSESTEPVWAEKDHVQVAEYWKIEREPFTLGVFPDGTVADVMEAKTRKSPVKTRKSFRNRVTQYLTNGAEILSEQEWPGKYIPIVIVPGKELWVSEEGGSKRIWESLQRKARGPQQLVNYYASTEAEVVRMVPKTPFIAAKGQIINPQEWQSVNDTPLAYLLHDPWAGNPTGQGGALPPPARPAYDPPVQALEMGKESARRAVQSAMGVMPMPTMAQRQNEKSGKALERIQDETQKGSYHFVDNYERSLMHAGRIIEDLLPKIYDSARTEVFTKQDETHEIKKINQDFTDAQGNAQHLKFDGDHDVTISTGPSFQSEREQADDFVDTFFPVIGNLPVDPPVKAQLVALAIKLKDLGPIGDQMAEAIFPAKNAQIPPAAQAQIAKISQELQLAQTTIAQLMQEKVHEMAKNQTTLQKAGIDMTKAIAVAEIGARAQAASERQEAYNEAQAVIHQSAHEVGMSTLEHAQALQQGQQAAATASAQSAQDAGQEAAAQAAEPASGD